MMDILSATDVFALAAVMLIGLPHGAFDGAIAFCLGFGRSTSKIIGFSKPLNLFIESKVILFSYPSLI